MTTKSKTTKTKARNTARRRWVPLPPRGMRPKLDRSTLTSIAIVHMTNLDDITKGRATLDTLWHVVENVLTWSNVSQALKVGVPEMKLQLELANRLLQRYGQTGRVGFTGVEYQMAKLGIEVMDALASTVDRPTAEEAVRLSYLQMAKVKARAASLLQVQDLHPPATAPHTPTNAPTTGTHP
jgi:hypothetical protein